VKLLDANVLLYAHHTGLPQHERAKAWLEDVLRGGETVTIAWLTAIAFLRIATNARAFPRPYSTAEAVGILDGLFRRSNVRILEPDERHWAILRPLLIEAQARADLVTDAHLAALAIEHGATFCTSDRDFARFPGLSVVNPLES
jgi:toxin-antitoxin system PIN domain toxin